MRLLCLSAQLPGHLDWGGYLATARALQARGHEVLWASGVEVLPLLDRQGIPAHALETTGWRWPPPPPIRPQPGADRQQFTQSRMVRALDQWLDVARVSAATDELATVVGDFQPDLILSEMFVAAAGLVAEQFDTPLAVVGWPAPGENLAPAGQDAVVAEARNRLDTLLARFGLTGVNWTRQGVPALHSPLLHLTYWSERWMGRAAMDPTRHVGGISDVCPPDVVRHDVVRHDAGQPKLPDPDEPWVLITLGTSFNNDPEFFVAAAHAADRVGAIPLLVLGKSLSDATVITLRERLPASAALYELLDLPATLPNLSAAVHHGGAGTTHALVTHGVPQIVVPHAADQQHQAQGVARTGVGFHMAPRQASVDNLVAALSLLLPDRSEYRQQAAILRQEFADLGGVPRAADIIEQLAPIPNS